MTEERAEDQKPQVGAGELNFWRQLDVFDPGAFAKRVIVVGCGAIGSHLIDTLMRIGIKRIEVADFDDVEDHNLPNQIFTLDDLGKKKVEAMAEHAKRLGVELVVSTDKVETIDTNEPTYVLLAVDSMAARDSIYKSVEYNPNVRVIESRMAAEYGIIHALDPSDPDHNAFWDARMFDDDEDDAPACTNRAVATTAKLMASVITHYLVMWEANDQPQPHTLVSLRPLLVTHDNLAGVLEAANAAE